MHRDIGKGSQAVFFAELEVEHAVHRDQAKQVDFSLAKQAQKLAGVIQHEGLARITGVNGITRAGHALGIVRMHPGALGEVDGGQAQ